MIAKKAEPTALDRALARQPKAKELAQMAAAGQMYSRLMSEEMRIRLALKLKARGTCCICKSRPVGAGMTCGQHNCVSRFLRIGIDNLEVMINE